MIKWTFPSLHLPFLPSSLYQLGGCFPRAPHPLNNETGPDYVLSAPTTKTPLTNPPVVSHFPVPPPLPVTRTTTTTTAASWRTPIGLAYDNVHRSSSSRSSLMRIDGVPSAAGNHHHLRRCCCCCCLINRILKRVPLKDTSSPAHNWKSVS